MRICNFLEIDLYGVNCFHTAAFNGIDMVVEHHTAISLKLTNAFVQPVFAKECNQWQAKDDGFVVIVGQTYDASGVVFMRFVKIRRLVKALLYRGASLCGHACATESSRRWLL